MCYKEENEAAHQIAAAMKGRGSDIRRIVEPPNGLVSILEMDMDSNASLKWAPLRDYAFRPRLVYKKKVYSYFRKLEDTLH